MDMESASPGGGRFCLRCSAALPESRESALCVLCASGLGPPHPLRGAPSEAAESQSADPESDSGVRCPHCRSRLSYRDVGRQLCPVCGEGTGIDSLFRPDAAASTPDNPGLKFSAPLETWRADEPLWDMQHPIW